MSGLRFGSVMWRKGRTIIESVKSDLLYQGISLNFNKADILVTSTEEEVYRVDLKYVEIFSFTYNFVFDSMLYKGTNKNLLLFGISLWLYHLDGKGFSLVCVSHCCNVDY